MNTYKNKTRSVDVGSILVYCEMRRFKVRKVSRCAIEQCARTAMLVGICSSWRNFNQLYR